MKFRIRTSHAFRSNVALIALLAACAPEPERDRSNVIEAQLVRQTGLPRSDGTGLVFDAEWIGDSAIAVVLDPGTAVHVVRWNGKHRRIGSAGSGPGEFRGVSTVTASHDRIIAIDGVLRRASLWDTTGKMLGEIALPLTLIGDAWSTDSGPIVRSHTRFASRILLSRVDFASRSLQQLRSIDISLPLPDRSCQYCKIGLGPDLYTAQAVSSDSLYLIRRRNADGSELPSIDRGVYPLVVTTSRERDSVDAFQKREIARYSSNPLVARSLEEAFESFPPKKQKRLFVSAPYVDEQHRVWIQRSTSAGADAEIDVLGPDGTLEMIIRLPPGVRLLGVRRNTMLVVHGSEDGDGAISEYLAPLDNRSASRPTS